MGQLPQGLLAHRGKLGAQHLAGQRLPSKERMGMPAGRLSKAPCLMTISNRPLRNRTVGGVGGRRRNTCVSYPILILFIS